MNNEQFEKEITKSLIPNSNQKNKILRRDLYNENYRTLLEEIKDMNKQKHILCSGIRTLNKMSTE